MQSKVSLNQLNLFSCEQFVEKIGPVFEASPWIAQIAWSKRPFATLEELHAILCGTVREASREKQLALIRSHPDLVGRAALAGTLSPESNREQAIAGLLNLTAEEIASFQQFNHAYHQKFGFPFVICARLNKKEAVLQAFPVRLRHGPEQEMETALDEIGKIAYLRLLDIVAS